jgi:hypothetical protein
MMELTPVTLLTPKRRLVMAALARRFFERFLLVDKVVKGPVLKLK